MGSSRIFRARYALLAVALTMLALGVGTTVLTAAAEPLKCYTVADDGGGIGSDTGAEDLLTLVDTTDANPATNETNVGTGTDSFGVEAIAFDAGGTLFGVDEGRLGTFDLTTGQFSPRPSPVGSGNGEAGPVTFNNIDGITFDPGDGTLFGVQRRRSAPPDVLLKIDPATGMHVPNAFGPGADYVVVDAVGTLANIDDIAFTPDGVMYGIANDEGKNDVLVTIDPDTGDPTPVGTLGVDDMEGLTSTSSGALLGTTGKNGRIPDTMWDIDRATGTASNPRRLDNGSDYESLACPAAEVPPDTPVVTLSKTICPGEPAKLGSPGGTVPLRIDFTVAVTSVTDATLVDQLPQGLTPVQPVPAIAGADPVVDANTNTITWSWPELATGSYSASFDVLIGADVPPGSTLTNLVTFDGSNLDPPVTASDTLTVTAGGPPSADGRAFGINLFLLGSEIIAPTPDSDVTNPGELLAIPDPFGSDTPLVRVLGVDESNDSTPDEAAHSARASALDVDLNIPDVLHLQASTVVANVSSRASGTSATSSRGGSLIQDLRINGETIGVVTEPTTILVRDPLSGDVLAEVHLLETIRSGAAAGEPQPADGSFSSGITVNGIHVKVHLLDLADLIVSHAETSATFPAAGACQTGEPLPSVSGDAYALGLDLRPDSDEGIDLGTVRVAEVKLPSTGGEDSATLAHVNVPGVVVADAVGASTEGEITDGPDDDTIPVEATSEAHVAEVNLLDGTILATLVKAESHSDLESEPAGHTTIAHLEIGGTDICEAIGLTSICEPEPNTELLIPGGPILVMLNEQIPETGGLTVNAVHIWILGKDNPFGLPVGASIVISSAHSDAHPAGPVVISDRITTLNVRALSSRAPATAPRIRAPQGYRLPVTAPGRVPSSSPRVSVPEILSDPVAVVSDLGDLALPEQVLEDATQLVETLTNPETLLEAIADPSSLLETLGDPAAVVDALARALGIEDTSSDAGAGAPTAEGLEAKLLRVVGV